MDVMQVKADAVRRVLARQRAPEYATVSRNADGTDTRVQTGGGPGDYLGPVSASEWLDDRLARTPLRSGDQASEALAAIAEAARDGEKSARDAVGQARHLTEWQAFQVYATLAGWTGQDTHPDAAPVMRAVLAEWGRRGLAVTQPDPEDLTVVTVNQADLDATEALVRRSRGW